MLLIMPRPAYAIISVIVKFQLPTSFQPSSGARLANFPGLSQFLWTVNPEYHTRKYKVKYNLKNDWDDENNLAGRS